MKYSDDDVEQLVQARTRVFVFGKTGTGKSTWLKRLLERLMKRFRIVAFDSLDELSIYGEPTDDVELGSLTERCTVDELLDDPVRWLARPDLALAVVPEDSDDDKLTADDFRAVADMVKAEARRAFQSGEPFRKIVFVIEEPGLFEEYCRSKLRAVAKTFRHWGVCVIFVAQRAVDVPLGARSQASIIVSFLQDEDADVDALERRTRRTDPDFAERVSRLTLHDYEVWRDPAYGQKGELPCTPSSNSRSAQPSPSP